MRKRTLLAGAAAFALAVGGITTGAAAADISAEPEDAIAITEVTPFGLKVTGLAVKYSDEIDLGDLDIDEAAFEIAVELTALDIADVTGERTILKAYTNAAPEFASAQTPGRYIILELDENDATASASWYDGMFTQQYDLIGSHVVTQKKDLVGAEDTLHASPEIETANSSVVNLIVDEYAAKTLSAANGVKVPYRLFTPALAAGERYPLVVTLHGHGESGTDNFAPITGNQISVAFANPAMQAANPSFVLSPQAGQSPPMGENGWWNANVQAAVIELVEATIANYPQIDPDRVYLTGLSMGAFGSWAILPEHSGLFAGAILVCGAGDEDVAVPALGDFPIWVLHSEDDVVVPFDAPGSGLRIFKGFEEAGSPVIWTAWPGNESPDVQFDNAMKARAAADEVGSNHIFTKFPAGTTPVFSHFSWVPTYSNGAILDWLFAQTRVDVTIDTVPAPTLIASDQCDVEPVVELPADVVGISYEAAREGDQVVVVASALDGFVIAEGVTTEWTFDVAAEACPVDPTDPTDPTPDPTDPTEPVDQTDPADPTDTDTGSDDDMPTTGVSGLPIFAGIALAAIGAGLWLRRRAVQ